MMFSFHGVLADAVEVGGRLGVPAAANQDAAAANKTILIQRAKTGLLPGLWLAFSFAITTRPASPCALVARASKLRR